MEFNYENPDGFTVLLEVVYNYNPFGAGIDRFEIVEILDENGSTIPESDLTQKIIKQIKHKASDEYKDNYEFRLE